MALKDILDTAARRSTKPKSETEVTTDRIRACMSEMRKLIAYWRVYPDRFVDFLCSLNPNNTFKLYYYQRVYLRCVMRHQLCYCVFPRGYSKSFLGDLALILKAILYPGAQLFAVASGKEQSANILKEKVETICGLIPAVEKEIIWDNRNSGSKKKTVATKDSVTYSFKNGSSIRNIAASENSRGLRFHSGLVEECAMFDDQSILNEVIIPTMNVKRSINGEVDDNEVLNQSQLFITTAGYKNSFSYEKLLQIFAQMVARPQKAIIIGGTWRVEKTGALLKRSERLASGVLIKNVKANGRRE